MYQREKQPVVQNQLRLASCPGRPLAFTTPRHAQRGLSGRLPWVGEFGEQLASVRETPDRAGWEHAVRAQVSFTTHLTRAALLTSLPTDPRQHFPQVASQWGSRSV